MIYGRCLMSQNHTSQSISLYSILGLCLCIILNNAFGGAKQFVCDAEMYRFQLLTDFHTARGLGFGIARKMLYLCRALGKCSASVGCGSA